MKKIDVTNTMVKDLLKIAKTNPGHLKSESGKTYWVIAQCSKVKFQGEKSPL